MNNTKIAFGALLLTLLSTNLFITGCKDDDSSTEQENITKVVLHFSGPGLDAEFEWNDPDGPGGNAPEIDEITLPPLTGNINCHLHVYDSNRDLTDEIAAEAAEHLIVYLPEASIDAVWTYADADGNGKPLGLETSWTTDQPSSGNLRVVLYHEPVNKGDLNNPGGETDFDVTFPVRIQ